MIVFNGEQYSSEKKWAEAYPAYGLHYARYVTAGCDTVMKLEQAIFENNRKKHHARQKAALVSPMNNSQKARKAR